jgi:hypothetical protein
VPHPSFAHGVRGICDRYGVRLVFDEVVTAFRTGRFLAAHHDPEIRPDAVVLPLVGSKTDIIRCPDHHPCHGASLQVAARGGHHSGFPPTPPPGLFLATSEDRDLAVDIPGDGGRKGKVVPGST